MLGTEFVTGRHTVDQHSMFMLILKSDTGPLTSQPMLKQHPAAVSALVVMSSAFVQQSDVFAATISHGPGCALHYTALHSSSDAL